MFNKIKNGEIMLQSPKNDQIKYKSEMNVRKKRKKKYKSNEIRTTLYNIEKLF